MRGIQATRRLFRRFDGNLSETARHIGGGVFPIEISRAINDGYVSKKLEKALEDHPNEYLKKEVRHRVWMPTDDLAGAVRQLKKHYPEVVRVVTQSDIDIEEWRFPHE